MMDFDEWVLTINPRYKPTDDSPLTRYLRRTWAAATEQQAAEVERLRAELAECIAALEKIANPIGAMKRALPVGATLNGAMATTLSNDPNYLKEIAKAALAARKGEGE